MVTSILKSLPSCGKLFWRYSLSSARGTAIPRAALSMLTMEISLTIPLIIGMTDVRIEIRTPSTMIMENAASSQSGAFFPLMRIFCISPMRGLAISDTTTAIRIYASTLLKNQHVAQIAAAPAATRMYFASLSVYLSFCSIPSVINLQEWPCIHLPPCLQASMANTMPVLPSS